MIRPGELALFGTLAAGLHVAALAGWSDDPPGGGPAAPGAPQAVAVRTADPALRALVEDWGHPPAAATTAATPAMERAALEAPAPPPMRDAGTARLPPPSGRSRPDAVARRAPPDPIEPARPVPRPEATPAASAAVRGAAGPRATPPAAPRPAAAEAAALTRTFAAGVRAALAAALVYPDAAIDRGAAGVPTLEITLDRAGRLRAARIARPSGSAMLDAAALRTARRARFPAAPDAVPGSSFAFSVPLRFELR